MTTAGATKSPGNKGDTEYSPRQQGIDVQDGWELQDEITDSRASLQASRGQQCCAVVQ